MAPTKANKEVDEALQAITAQLEVLQTQLENKQQLQDSRRLHLQQSMDSRQEALQTFLANLKEQLTVQQPSPPPFMLGMSLPPFTSSIPPSFSPIYVTTPISTPSSFSFFTINNGNYPPPNTETLPFSTPLTPPFSIPPIFPSSFLPIFPTFSLT